MPVVVGSGATGGVRRWWLAERAYGCWCSKPPQSQSHPGLRSEPLTACAGSGKAQQRRQRLRPSTLATGKPTLDSTRRAPEPHTTPRSGGPCLEPWPQVGGRSLTWGGMQPCGSRLSEVQAGLPAMGKRPLLADRKPRPGALLTAAWKRAAGVHGQRDGLPPLPDGSFLPPLP